MSDNRVHTDAVPPLHLPPTPGPFASLTQWREKRDQLVNLGLGVPGVDAKLNIANSTMAAMTRGLEVERRGHLGVDSGMSDVQKNRLALRPSKETNAIDPLSESDLQNTQVPQRSTYEVSSALDVSHQPTRHFQSRRRLLCVAPVSSAGNSQKLCRTRRRRPVAGDAVDPCRHVQSQGGSSSPHKSGNGWQDADSRIAWGDYPRLEPCIRCESGCPSERGNQ